MNESPETLKYLWYPELEIYGLETFTRQKVLKEMSGVRIMKNKTINYELKWGIDIWFYAKSCGIINIFSVHITISCQMNFDDYPLDAHACQFQVGSCELSKLWLMSQLTDFRLWHRGGGKMQRSLYLRCSQTAKFTALDPDRGTSESFQNSSTSFRSDTRRTKKLSFVLRFSSPEFSDFNQNKTKWSTKHQ